MITPVATSATLGDKGDPKAMLGFAETVFGVPFDDDAVVTETRLSLTEWVNGAAERVKAAALQAVPTSIIDLEHGERGRSTHSGPTRPVSDLARRRARPPLHRHRAG